MKQNREGIAKLLDQVTELDKKVAKPLWEFSEELRSNRVPSPEKYLEGLSPEEQEHLKKLMAASTILAAEAAAKRKKA